MSDDEDTPTEVIQPSQYQHAILSMPETVNLLLAGGRGGGKSYAIMFLLLRHAHQYGGKAYALLVRESYEAIKQLEEDFEMLLLQVFGRAVRHNKTEHTFYFPSGAKVQFAQLGEQKDYVKFQGKSYTLLIVDEYGALKVTKWITLLMSNLRGDKSVPTRTVLACNPGGAQHGHVNHDFIVQAPAWTPYEREGEVWANCPSTWRDNPHINHESYLKKLRAACKGDEALFKAWDTGDWNIARGAYFSGVLDREIHEIPNANFPIAKLDPSWNPYLAGDWGSGAPSVVYVCAESPGVKNFPRGSVLLCDELATHDPEDLNLGLNWPPSKLADATKRLCEPWGCYPEGVFDDAYGLSERLLEQFEEYGLYVSLPDKQRVAGWQKMREMLMAAKDRTGQPGLWISERCQYLWKTMPFIQRDDRDPEDILTTGPDHGCDAARYGVMHSGRTATQTSLTGTY